MRKAVVLTSLFTLFFTLNAQAQSQVLNAPLIDFELDKNIKGPASMEYFGYLQVNLKSQKVNLTVTGQSQCRVNNCPRDLQRVLADTVTITSTQTTDNGTWVVNAERNSSDPHEPSVSVTVWDYTETFDSVQRDNFVKVKYVKTYIDDRTQRSVREVSTLWAPAFVPKNY